MTGSNESRSPITIVATGDGFGVFTAREILAGTFIGTFTGAEGPLRTRMSLQFGPGLHVEPGVDEPLRYLNHACAPSGVFRGRDLFAARDLAAGSEVTIDYNVHEDTISHPFVCHCGAARCVGLVRGGGPHHD